MTEVQLRNLKEPLLPNEDGQGYPTKQNNHQAAKACPFALCLFDSPEQIHSAVGIIPLLSWVLLCAVLLLGAGLSLGVWVGPHETWETIYLEHENAYTALVILTALLPPGLFLLGSIMHVIERQTSGLARFVIFSVMTAFWMVILIVSLAHVPFKCGKYFTASHVLTFYKGNKLEPAYKFSSIQYGNGFDVVWALMAAVTSVAFLIFSALPLIKTIAAQRRESNGMHEKSSTHDTNFKRKRNHAAVFFLLVLYLPVCFILTLFLPNIWEYMTPEGIAYQQVAPAVDSWRIPLTDRSNPLANLKLTVYEDVLAYYLFIYLISIVAYSAQAYPPLHRLLHRRLAVPRPRVNTWVPDSVYFYLAGHAKDAFPAGNKGTFVAKQLYTTVGEALVFLLFLALAVWWFVFWYVRHSYTGLAPLSSLQRLARAFGALSNLFLSLLFLPVARNSLWSTVFGVPYERAIRYHRFLGHAFLSSATAHMATFWAVFANEKVCSSPGSYVADAYCSFPSILMATGKSADNNYHADNFTIPLMQLIYIFTMLFMFLCSRDYVRRFHFELFYYSHHFAHVLVMGALWHASSLWYYLIAGLGLWLFDRIIRFCKSASPTRTIDALALHPMGAEAMAGRSDAPRVTKLTVKVSDISIRSKAGRLQYAAGQYAFVNIPSVSMFQWHPFTIASSPGDENLTFYIKHMGDGTFTGRLYETVLEQNRQKANRGAGTSHDAGSITVNVDGAYGAPPEFGEVEEVVLLAGGIGITPMISVLREHQHKCAHANSAKTETPAPALRIHLVWVCRRAAEFSILHDTLATLELDECSSRVSLYATREPETGVVKDLSGKMASSDLGLRYERGRPELRELIKYADPTKAAVFACGPPGMIDDASAICLDLGVTFHQETFML